jgi:hypothetical protein
MICLEKNSIISILQKNNQIYKNKFSKNIFFIAVQLNSTTVQVVILRSEATKNLTFSGIFQHRKALTIHH